MNTLTQPSRTSEYAPLPEPERGPDVLGPQSKVPKTPLSALDFPDMLPPELGQFETAPCERLMHWYDGPIRIEGFKAGWFQSRDVALYYVEGPPNGPPLLMFPGQQDPWHSYRASLKALSQRFHVFIMEHRGHGFSERHPPGDYRVMDYVRNAADFAEHVIGEPAFLTGHSLGSVMVCAMWDQFPQWVRGASLEDGPFFIMTQDRYEGSEAFIETSTFGPPRAMAHAVQERSASMVTVAQHKAVSPMILWPEHFLQGADNRQYFVDWIMKQGLKEKLDILPENDKAYYYANWQSYVETGIGGPQADYMPFPFLEPMNPLYMKTDWRTTISHFDGRWLEGFDERRAFSTLSVPTIFWLADQKIIALHTQDDIDEALTLAQTIERPFQFIEVEHAGHYIHKDETELFTRKLIEMFADADA